MRTLNPIFWIGVLCGLCMPSKPSVSGAAMQSLTERLRGTSKTSTMAMDEQEYRVQEAYTTGYDEGFSLAGAEMRKADLELIAQVLAAHKPERDPFPEYHNWLHLVTAFEAALAKENPNFKRSTFLEACHAINSDTAKFLKLNEKQNGSN